MVGARLPDQRGPVALTDAALVGDDAQPVDEPDDAQPATTGAHTGEDGRTEAHGIAPARWVARHRGRRGSSGEAVPDPRWALSLGSQRTPFCTVLLSSVKK